MGWCYRIALVDIYDICTVHCRICRVSAEGKNLTALGGSPFPALLVSCLIYYRVVSHSIDGDDACRLICRTCSICQYACFQKLRHFGCGTSYICSCRVCRKYGGSFIAVAAYLLDTFLIGVPFDIVEVPGFRRDYVLRYNRISEDLPVSSTSSMEFQQVCAPPGSQI